MKKILAVACVLLPVAAYAQSQSEASGNQTAPPSAAAAATTSEAAGAEEGQPDQQAAPAPEPELTPEEAAKAAKEGKLQYSKAVTNPNEATAAEIAAHNATAEPEDRVTCKKVKPTGSNRPMKFCSTPKQRQAMREAAQQGMESSGVQDIGRRNPGKLETMQGGR